ncbi:MAG: hypothetical protein MK135_16395, partial [Polyangiaceae bacterium]|nr:hypothetical protein [Polyangiaceae bacterium]
MLPAKLATNLELLSKALADDPMLSDLLSAHWVSRGRDPEAALSEEEAAAADAIDRSLPSLSRSDSLAARLKDSLEGSSGNLILLWCEASVGRSDIQIAPLLSLAHEVDHSKERTQQLAHERLLQGPGLDALNCAPLIGPGSYLASEEATQARARLEILIWNAGASAMSCPRLGDWLWNDPATFDILVQKPSEGALRGRVLAARCLEICVGSFSGAAHAPLMGRALQLLQPLLLHPEPLVSTHAARALGLLSGRVEQLEGMLLDWMSEDSLVKRRRAMTAFCCLPQARLTALAHEFRAALDGAGVDGWALGAAAAGTPYLFHEHRELWDEVYHRILQGDGGANAAEKLARGLATLWRRGEKRDALIAPLREIRAYAQRTQPEEVDDYRQWLNVLSHTDPVDEAERDPLDLETGLENLIALAAQYDDEEADARAARFARALEQNIEAAEEIALGEKKRMAAAGMNALEGSARAMALQLWTPQLRTHPRSEPISAPNLESTWQAIARAPTQLLEAIQERRDDPAIDSNPLTDVALEVLSVRLGGYALDACGSDIRLGPGKGPTAHQTCIWLSKIHGVADGSRPLPDNLKAALSGVFWRLVDTTRGTALGAVDDIEWLGPFAAWWALVIDRPAMLQQLGNALPLIRDGALERCCELAAKMRAAVISGKSDGAWGDDAQKALK